MLTMLRLGNIQIQQRQQQKRIHDSFGIGYF
jgi:hypothetical protein